MIGLKRFKLKQFDKLDYLAKPGSQLDEKNNFLKDLFQYFNHSLNLIVYIINFIYKELNEF